MSENQSGPVKSKKAEQKLEAAAKRIWGKAGKLAQEIFKGYKDLTRISYTYRWERASAFSGLHSAYTELCGISAESTGSFDSFWNSKLESAVEKLFGKEQTRELRDICELIFETPYSHSIYRPSYRSRRAGDYADSFFMALVHAVDFFCYELSLADIIRRNHTQICGFENRLALALRRDNAEITALIREAILGESGEIKLSHPIIRGVIKSGVSGQLELLGKLLLAAKGQEGVRQAILENSDCGSAQSHAYFLGLIIDNSLARFSSVIRAFGTWTGLEYDNAKPAVIDKCIRLAHGHLSDGARFGDGLKSEDSLEVYMALWAQSSRDIFAAKDGAEGLVDTPEKYRRLVGWYFLHSTVHEKVAHEIAIRHIGVREPEELAWICRCLYRNSSAARRSWGNHENAAFFKDEALPESQSARKAQFDKLCDVVDFIGNKKTQFEGSVFPWMDVQLGAQDPVRCMLGLAGYDREPSLILRLSQYLTVMDVDNRMAFYMNLLDTGIPEQRELMLRGLSDKSPTIKNDIVERLEKEELAAADIKYLSNTLTTTGSALRKAVMSLLGKQTEALVRPALDTLLDSSDDKQLLAGVELLDIFGGKNPKLRQEYDDKISGLRSRANLQNDVAVILGRFDTDKAGADFTPENGFGLYNPAAPVFDREAQEAKRPKVTIYGRKELEKLLNIGDNELRGALAAVRDVILTHQGMEVETEGYDGSKHKALIGDNNYRLPTIPEAERKPEARGIYCYYLADEIVAALDKAGVTPVDIARILCCGVSGLDYGSEFTPAATRIFGGLPFDDGLHFNKHVGPLSAIVRNILISVLEAKSEGVFDFAMSVWKSLVSLIPESDIMESYQTKTTAQYYPPRSDNQCMLKIGIISAWRGRAHQHIENDEQFAAFWNELWAQYLAVEREYLPDCSSLDLPRAYKLGLLSEDGLLHELTLGANAGNHIRYFTGSANWAKNLQKQAAEEYPFFAAYIDKATDRIAAVEEKRGELPTPLTPVAAQIGYFKGGAKRFAALLTALGKDNFHRGYVWYERGQTKRTTLSVLMKNCYPLPDDTPEVLGEELKAAGISQKRLLQAVMYAPQWAELAQEATGIDGLAGAVWLFHAHINERFSAEKETKVALYSPISQQQFSDGAFDKDWFLQAYNTVGEKVFNELYKNAKYITESSSAHRRSQLYADAVLGRLDKAETEDEICGKRNQEKLRAYALIPPDKNDPGDALHRYEFIQRYAKESRQFGSQRQASEKKAVLIALQNLALTTGFGDADRMTWYLESEKMESLRPLIEPNDIGGVTVSLAFERDGTPFIDVTKDGKALKSLPKKYAKNETAAQLQVAVKELKEQKKRAKSGFEMAMVSRTEFGTQEILRLLGHPVLSNMIGSLVFVSDGRIGFPSVKDAALCLTSPDGAVSALAEGDTLIIAHPFDLIESKCWSEYQRHLYKNQMVQPFKQVFREYYPITVDEKAEVNISRRYAGHQVQPQKTVALLKTRGWTVDYEEGLQRVYHKENLIARMYAMADWFSPSDIEAPTLEVVRFYYRDNGKPIAFDEVPPVVFSEVMRDIDLVVSVAHVGGVDPEASHSTIEMRIAIAKELLSLLSVKNVGFQSAHAQIKGGMGEYSVHMGSGVVHQSGVGMLAVLPVHSQARGRIFLPFADDDPKTAEIMSKLLLFADDKKIKDPAILSQING